MQPALRAFARYASLNVLGMIGLSCYILADTFFVARGLGADGLTALNLAVPVYSFVHGSGLMLGMGYTEEELNRPLIAVVNSWNEYNPGHVHLNQLAERVKQGIREAGGLPL